MNLSRPLLLALSILSLSGLLGCAEREDPAATPDGAEARTLPGNVELVSSSIKKEGGALRGEGTLRFPWSSSPREVRYEVTGTPADVPERYDVHTTTAETGASARLAYQLEAGIVTIEVPGHVAEVIHNPDGSYSLAGKAYASLRDAARALAHDTAMAPLSAELLAASTVGLGATTRAAGTRIADGYCDPVWYCVDPDCPHCARAFEESYTCERWGQDSEGCSFMQAYEP